MTDVAQAAPAPDDLHEDPTLVALDEGWAHLFGAIRRAKVRQAREPSPGMSLAQYTLLRPLHDGVAVSVGELAAGAGVTAPTASRMIDALERDGLVKRRSSERDRRSVEVVLTPDGEKLAAIKRDALAQDRLEIFAGLSAEEREQAGVLLHRLADAIERLL